MSNQVTTTPPWHILNDIQTQAFDAFLSSPCQCDKIVFVKNMYNHVDDYIFYYGANWINIYCCHYWSASVVATFEIGLDRIG